MTARVVAQWRHARGKAWVDLLADEYGYSYKADWAGGSLGTLPDDETAIHIMQERVDSGYFTPDAYKTPMHRAV